MKRRKFAARGITLGLAAIVSPKAFASVIGLQKPKKDTIITVIVDTENINQDNKNQMTEIVDNRGGASRGGRHREFTTNIDYDKWVVWDGRPMSNSDHYVNIIQIAKKSVGGGKTLLKKSVYNGETQVRAKARKKYEEGEELYDIHFDVVRGGSAERFVIDPKLKINP